MAILLIVLSLSVFTGRKKSLRSLEIPLENLLSGVVFLSGTAISAYLSSFCRSSCTLYLSAVYLLYMYTVCYDLYVTVLLLAFDVVWD